MADETRLSDLVEQLNGALGDVTPYRLAVVNPGDVLPIDKNARYMSKRTYDQLVANVSNDKNLSSIPFCWKGPEGQFVALSGNHRVMAAKDAGIPLILVLYTDAKLSKAKQRAIQLSHNALVGQDNPATLRERIIAREPDGWFGLEYLLDEMQRLHATMPSLEGVHVVLDTERLRFNRSRSPFARRVPTCSGPPHDDVTVIAPQQPCWAVDPLHRVT